jgi:transposase
MRSRWAKQMQALKGVDPVFVATVIAEVGDFSRFSHPRQLVAHFALACGEHSSGNAVRPWGITEAGSSVVASGYPSADVAPCRIL